MRMIRLYRNRGGNERGYAARKSGVAGSRAVVARMEVEDAVTVRVSNGEDARDVQEELGNDHCLPLGVLLLRNRENPLSTCV